MKNTEALEALSAPTISIEKARELLGLSRSAAYGAVKRGEIPTIRIGGRILVLTVPLRRKLELDQA